MWLRLQLGVSTCGRMNVSRRHSASAQTFSLLSALTAMALLMEAARRSLFFFFSISSDTRLKKSSG